MNKFTRDTMTRLQAVAAALKDDRAYAAGVCCDAMGVINGLQKEIEDQQRTIAVLRASLDWSDRIVAEVAAG